MPSTKYLAAAMLAALLAGCASAPVRTYSPDSFEAAGRLSVHYRKDGNPESLTVKYSWLQTPGRIDVTLSSPLSTVATISITPQSATLVQANKPPRVAKDIDTLTADALGWSLPVSGLRDWLQGYATGTDGKRFAVTPANNNVLTADGWRLRFVSWQDQGKDPATARPMPRRIDAQRVAGATVEELAINIIIDPQG